MTGTDLSPTTRQLPTVRYRHIHATVAVVAVVCLLLAIWDVGPAGRWCLTGGLLALVSCVMVAASPTRPRP